MPETDDQAWPKGYRRAAGETPKNTAENVEAFTAPNTTKAAKASKNKTRK